MILHWCREQWHIYISILEYHEDRMAYEINHMMLGFVGWVLQFLCSIHPAKILLISLLGQIWCFFAWRPFVAAGSLAPNTPFPSKHFFFYVVSLLNILSYWVIFFHMNHFSLPVIGWPICIFFPSRDRRQTSAEAGPADRAGSDCDAAAGEVTGWWLECHWKPEKVCVCTQCTPQCTS